MSATPVESQPMIPRAGLAPGCPAHAGPDGVWKIQDYATARAFLREAGTRQAGFNAENVHRVSAKMRVPVLYRDGAEHREHRKQTARYFTPKRVDTAYRDMMNRLAGEQCAELRRRGEADLADLSFKLAVAVAAEVVGLTDAGRGMSRRLDNFFAEQGNPGWRHPIKAVRTLLGQFNLGFFYYFDVRPSIRARRRERRDDLISHLLDEGCTGPEILGECVTFAAAGMITTREFIVVAAWHLLTDPELRERYVQAGEKERFGILHEILRVEPVVSNLYRRTTADIAAGDRTIPAGALVDVGVAAANLDPAAVGADPGAVCPARPVADGVGEAGLSFGDGAHRCPGAYIAIQESDIFLSKLLAEPGLELVQEPTVRIRPEIAAYKLVGLRLRVRG
ncbi:cytochrome P450 [Actinoplanes sp. CA-030573]|uniref:cytochrome P450 n=1 Tax=Actinoplanes sp. CA-030573 TaxID=3239898 RepID=UPI003D92395F